MDERFRHRLLWLFSSLWVTAWHWNRFRDCYPIWRKRHRYLCHKRHIPLR